MKVKERVIIIGSLITCFLIQAQGADKYTDGNRPYEFGFSIDGEQHRHEKKDEKGLIEGEFGFITADGVYHVTVYATDEQGRFKILSMKNIRVKPYPTYTAKQSSTSARQGHSLDLSASSGTAAPPAVTTTTVKPIFIQPPANSCSHCSLPTTSTPPPVVPAFNQPLNNSPNQVGASVSPKFPQGVKSFGSQQNGAIPFLQQGVGNEPPQQNTQNYPIQPQNRFVAQSPLEQELVPPQFEQNVPRQNSLTGNNDPQRTPQGPGSGLQSFGAPSFPLQQPQTPGSSPSGPKITYTENKPGVVGLNGEQLGPQGPNSAQYPVASSAPAQGNVARGKTPRRLDFEQSFGPGGAQPNSLLRGSPNSPLAPSLPAKPVLISAQMQIVDKNTDIYRRGPGEKEGLPEGITKGDMGNLLYTFNYTVGFHGHFEEGYTNGAKQGYYFVTGRNGVRTRVDYVADSKGFRPKISQEVLDLLSDDVPKPETEREEKYGLKGYEFKWLYYPVDAKGQ